MSEKKTDDSNVMDTASSWWDGIAGEFKRISWPNRPTVAKMTIAAIVTSGIVGVIIFGYDISLGFIYDNAYDLIRGFFTNGS